MSFVLYITLDVIWKISNSVSTCDFAVCINLPITSSFNSYSDSLKLSGYIFPCLDHPPSHGLDLCVKETDHPLVKEITLESSNQDVQSIDSTLFGTLLLKSCYLVTSMLTTRSG